MDHRLDNAMKKTSLLFLFTVCAVLFAEDVKPLELPQINAEQRAKFWRAAKELAEWQARQIQAQSMASQAKIAVDQVRSELAKTCGYKAILAEDSAGEPICQPRKSDEKSDEKPKAK